MDACNLKYGELIVGGFWNECFRRCTGTLVDVFGWGLPIPPGGPADAGPHDRQCCREAREIYLKDKGMRWDEFNAPGMTMCCEGRQLICIYDDTIANVVFFTPDPDRDPRALQIIRLCAIVHERKHLDHVDCSCPDKYREGGHLTMVGGKPGYEGEAGGVKAELEAYLAELDCLDAQQKLCGENLKCKSQVDDRIARIASKIGRAGSHIR